MITVTLRLARLELFGYFGGHEGLEGLVGCICGVREGQIIILKLLLDIEFIELVIHGVIWFFGNG